MVKKDTCGGYVNVACVTGFYCTCNSGNEYI